MLRSHYTWEEVAPLPKEEQEKIAQKLDISPFLVKVLKQRGLTSAEEMAQALEPPQRLHEPKLLFDMEKALNRILNAIENNEKILIYGDYDADGITSASILKEAFEILGVEVLVYLPDRQVDGYGPNQAVYEYYLRQGVTLIITCDNGVKGFEAIAYAKNQGTDVIVTDHHELSDELPEAYAIIHPRHPLGEYPFGDLSGAGVALKLAWALLEEIPYQLFDLAAIGTVADLVTVQDENQTIIALGLEQLRQTDRLGLLALYKELAITPAQIDEEAISFQIAPRLNALGRISNANTGVDCLTTFDVHLAHNTVLEMEKINNERKQIVEKICQEAKAQLDKTPSLHEQNLLILANRNWHEGVLGIVASRLAEQYKKPAIVLTEASDHKHYKGSARSIPGVNINSLLVETREYLVNFGGHEMAAGLTVEKTAFNDWLKVINKKSAASIARLTKEKRLAIPIDATDISLTHIHELERLGPFGVGNEMPLFTMKIHEGAQIQRIGKGQNTLKIVSNTKQYHFQGIGFRMGDYQKYLTSGAPFEILFAIKKNVWQGKESVQAIIKDIRQDAPAVYDLRQVRDKDTLFSLEETYYLFSEPKYLKAYQNLLPKNSKAGSVAEFIEAPEETLHNLLIFDCPVRLEALLKAIRVSQVRNIYLFAFSPWRAYLTGSPTREELGRVYQYFMQKPALQLKNKMTALARYLKLAPQKLKLILEIFLEMGLMEQQSERLRLLPTKDKVNLKNSEILNHYLNLIESEKLFLYNDTQRIAEIIFDQEESHEF